MFRRYLYHYHAYRDMDESVLMSLAAGAANQPVMQATGSSTTSSGNQPTQTSSPSPDPKTSYTSDPNSKTSTPATAIQTTPPTQPTPTPTNSPVNTTPENQTPTVKPDTEPKPPQIQPQPEKVSVVEPIDQPQTQPPDPIPTQPKAAPQNTPPPEPEKGPEQNIEPIIFDTSEAPPHATSYINILPTPTSIETPLELQSTSIQGLPTEIAAPVHSAPKSLSLLVATSSLSSIITSPHLAAPTASHTLTAEATSTDVTNPMPDSSRMTATSKASLIIGVVLLLAAGCLLFQVFVRNKKDERRRSTDDNEKLAYREIERTGTSSPILPTNTGNLSRPNTTSHSDNAMAKPNTSPPSCKAEGQINPFGNHAEVVVDPINASGPPVTDKVPASTPIARSSSQKVKLQTTGQSTSAPPNTHAMNPNQIEMVTGSPQLSKTPRVNDKSGAPPPQGMAVHRVQLAFTPSMDDELELRCGQVIRLLHEYDDGWAMCIRLDGSEQGVCPRTCLSARPLKPRPSNEQGPTAANHVSNSPEGQPSSQRENAAFSWQPVNETMRQKGTTGPNTNETSPRQQSSTIPMNSRHPQSPPQHNSPSNGPKCTNPAVQSQSNSPAMTPLSGPPKQNNTISMPASSPQSVKPEVSDASGLFSPLELQDKNSDCSQPLKKISNSSVEDNSASQHTDYFSYNKSAPINGQSYPSMNLNDSSAYPAPLQSSNSNGNVPAALSPASPNERVVPGQAL